MRSRCIVAYRAAGLGLLLAAVLAAGACSKNAESKPESKGGPARPQPPVPVAVAAVEQKAMPLQIQAIGSVEAFNMVSVKAQVGGELVKVHFKEGQDVKKGDMLFTIDRRPFQAALGQAEATTSQHQAQVRQGEANLARDEAQLENARVDLTRYRTLLAQDSISRQQVDTQAATVHQLEGTVVSSGARDISVTMRPASSAK